MAAVWAISVGSTDKFVLLALADAADENGRCWPSIATLGEKTGLSRRAVEGAIKRLQISGYIQVIHRHRHSNVFTLHQMPSPPQQVRVPPQQVRVYPHHVHSDPSRIRHLNHQGTSERLLRKIRIGKESKNLRLRQGLGIFAFERNSRLRPTRNTAMHCSGTNRPILRVRTR